MQHLHRHRDDSTNEEEHHHVSIASLRSKFESLAQGVPSGGDGTPSPSTVKPGAPAPASPSPTEPPASSVPPRVTTPIIQPPTPASLKSTASAPAVVSAKPAPRSPSPSNSVGASATGGGGSISPASAVSTSSTHLAQLSKPVPTSRPPSSRGSSPPPRPSAPKPSIVYPTAPKPESAAAAKPSSSSETHEKEKEEEHIASVQALRQRFGQSAPPVPAKSSTQVTTQRLNNDSPRVGTPTVQTLSEPGQQRSPFTSPSKAVQTAGTSPSSAASSVVLRQPSPSPLSTGSKPPPKPPKPPISRTQSSAASEATPTQLAPTPSVDSRSTSPSTGHRPAPPPPSRPQLTPSSGPSRASSPLSHRPAPPPPRIPSPSPSTSDTVTPPLTRPHLPVRKASLAATAGGDWNSVMAQQNNGPPPPIPGNRPKTVASSAVSTYPPPSAVAPGPGQLQAPASAPPTTDVVAPPLPQTRRPTLLPQPDNEVLVIPPPLPKTARPEASLTSTVSAPPPLPPASKRPLAAEPTTLPPLPARRLSVADPLHIPPPPGAASALPRRPSVADVPFPPPPSAPPLPGNKPLAPSLATNKVLPAHPTSEHAQRYRPRANTAAASMAPRLPVRQAALAPQDDGYQPPPPPLRSAANAVVAAVTPSKSPASGGAGLLRSNTASATLHRNGSTRTPTRNGSGGGGGGGGGDSDDEEEGGGSQQLASLAQRLLDEHPDSTQANRRPPQFSPHVRVSPAQSITSFAVHGRYACVAHNTVKVYDTQLGAEQPILIRDPKDTGLELRAKEPRITAMGFRPSPLPELQGRYLWCGNKDGHLWELDLQTGDTTLTKSFVHGGAVTHIMHCDQAMVTLDEVGKLQVWEDLDGGGSLKLTRTVRISEKVTFAKIVKGELWTATAPAVRSTTNVAGVRGPTVRVYDICAPSLLPPPLVALTTEWTGAATSATIMPLDPEKVYISHEGGFVSTWSTTSNVLVCLQVYKVSSTDILALEGVGERLWAANRRGQIHVWDINEKPWLTTNIWTCHDERPIQTLLVDPSSIAATGRFMLWSCSRDSLQAWDGLLAVDWIDKEMLERQPDYCHFREVRVLVCSWNIDSCRPSDLSGSTENTTFLDQLLRSVDSPDIIVFGFQEVVPLTDKKLTAKTLLFGHKGKDGGGATNDRVSERYRAWADKLSYAVRLAMRPDSPYVKVHSEQLVGLFSCMFVKESERDALRDVNITTVKRGIGGIYGNKGAIVARVVMDDTSMCFINVHLAAGQSHRAARTADLAAIMEDKAIFPAADKLPYVNGGNGTGILDHEMVVLNGDLNYRIDQRREVVISSIKSGDLDFLLEHDQLRKEMRGNHAFRLRNFAEGPIHFAPTYKYDPGTNNYDSSDKRRIPAWCDRVLYLKNDRVHPLNYERYEITCSDHKPVSAGLGMQVKRIDPVRMHNIQREVVQHWQQREKEILAKIADAYASLP